MIPAALVLRPEPGNVATCARLEATGIRAVSLPLFVARPIGWSLPNPALFDAVLFTSANAPRLGGDRLAVLRHLPALVVGQASAAAARAAGFAVAITGDRDVLALLAAARAAGFVRPLHLAGRDHRATGTPVACVYESAASDITPDALAAGLHGVALVLLHSARAAHRFAALLNREGRPRSALAVAAISPAVLHAAGSGWRWSAAAERPADTVLVELVRQRLTGSPSLGISTP